MPPALAGVIRANDESSDENFVARTGVASGMRARIASRLWRRAGGAPIGGEGVPSIGKPAPSVR